MHDFNLDFNILSSIKKLRNHFLPFMKKSFIIAAFFLGACLTQFASAQESESTRETRAKSLPSIPLIIRGGLNFSDLSISGSDEELSRRTSFNVGVLFDFPLGSRFSLQPGLLLTSKGFKEYGYDNSQPATLTCNATYLEVPLLLVCHLPLGDNAEWLVNLGPYFAYGIDGETTYETTAWGQKYSSKESIKTFGNDINGFNLFNRFDCGISFGTGLAYKKFSIGIQADLGLIDVKSPEYDMTYNLTQVTAKNRTISLNVSYML